MATARLINPTEMEGYTAWAIDTWPFGAGRFAGPDGRDWDAFRLTTDGAEFEWRTGADHVRRAAERLVRGELTYEQAASDPFVEQWLEGDRLAQIEESMEDEEPELAKLADLPAVEIARRLFMEYGPIVEDEKEPSIFGYYLEDDDSYLEDAARSLDLPPWARVATYADGGPGSGFENAAIVIDEGKDLGDLASWLAERVAREPRSAR